MSADRPNAIVVAIDGPAGAGKSTIAKLCARDLGYTYIDTGAMYRAVGLFARRRDELHTVVGAEDVSASIRTPEAAMDASAVSKVSEVRSALVALQRRMGSQGGIVMEGRDIGTVVFPDAELKVFISASARVRGKRRLGQMRERGQEGELETIIAEIKARDLQDSTRAHSPLRPASDALVLDTSQLGITRVRSILRRLAHARLDGELDLEGWDIPFDSDWPGAD